VQTRRRIGPLTVATYWYDEAAFAQSPTALSVLYTQQERIATAAPVRIAATTYVLDLTKTEDELLRAFDKKSAQYAIRRATRDGVTVALAAGDDDRRAFHAFYAEFARSKQIPEIALADLGQCDLLLARDGEGSLLGGSAFVRSADRTVYRYKYGATTHRLNANDLLIWEAIRHAKAAGFTVFDFGGAILPSAGLSGYEGHHHFKKKFGGEVASYYCFVRARGPLSWALRAVDLVVRRGWRGDYNRFVNAVGRVIPIRSG